MKEAINYEDGIVLAERNYAEMKAHGKKWLERNTPKFLRENLFYSFFITFHGKTRHIHIIHPPSVRNDKVFFKEFILES